MRQNPNYYEKLEVRKERCWVGNEVDTEAKPDSSVMWLLFGRALLSVFASLSSTHVHVRASHAPVAPK